MPLLCNRFRGKTKAVRLGSKKIFLIFLRKNLEVRKKVLTFAPLSASKNRKDKKEIHDYGLNIRIRSLGYLSS